MKMSTSRLRVDATAADTLVEAFRHRAHLVDHVDGFVDLHVLSGVTDLVHADYDLVAE